MRRSTSTVTPDNNTGSLTISDTWKYNLDGPSSTAREGGGLLSDREELEGVLEGDRLVVNFDNTNAPNYESSDTSALHRTASSSSP